ncbi:MAG TPA: 4-hydroxy-tetrahydrodipicolinate synthase [Clostridiaceae bacterium]|jgi:4-hydroxy-tetrahydrodipicolinate synthase|uniref:4-hydroxy-tetrahydrodipicolinate synthase n=1 Tax=Clostridium tyrobutyricum TaxID=1519 RepID=UPI000E82CBFD|nr:4-hydroxy-tetrahydrodipicolinate synthase [Clostridium tyrobutyricum]HAZ36428.1 4-hydroxy-tetrahydrodipicolinate synthase [Clostridiaceae bacterium]HBF76709.1 4-hydroxy-tetrahydrodipicolinate synthase [Clostridiaceae bacterium]HBG38613.1 4-hydroxy-tetrahydrodipicolinate synthase [Clostridiaceae bacterium]HBX48788.1 4-hydroxy-tetrahydrodipicolinate synthase [Clostridiaceae bacterium]HCL50702.1 4-hydroxy-tetrahydrodipicolinate synthase [Clostridiaceae bacterium]
MSVFTGSGVAIVTPFNKEGVDFEKLGELLEWHIKEKTDAIIICGTTGESSTMSLDEKKETIKYTVNKVNGRIPVIAGTGSNNTKAAVEMSVWAESIGVDALLLITPYYNKTTQRGCIEHFKAIANSVTKPIIIYNVPGRTGLNLLPQTLYELSKIKNIVAVKEASSNIDQISEIARLCGDNLDIYSGNDNETIPIMSLGGKGVISVLANILPRDTHDLCQKFLDGDLKGARDMQLKLLPLMNALFIETNPIPVKTAMNLMGMNVGHLRLPLVDMSEKNLEALKKEMINYGIKL